MLFYQLHSLHQNILLPSFARWSPRLRDVWTAAVLKRKRWNNEPNATTSATTDHFCERLFQFYSGADNKSKDKKNNRDIFFFN